MEIQGKLIKRQGNKITVELPDDAPNYLIDKYDPNHDREVGIWFDDKRKITTKQRHFAFAILGDIQKAYYGGAWTDTYNQVRAHFDYQYLLEHEDAESISLSRRYGNMTQANEYISMLVEFCIKNNVPIFVRPLDVLQGEELYKYEYSCVMNRKCIVCGIDGADLHHLEGSRIGIGNNRNKVNHLGRRVLTLCRKHHDLIGHHQEKEFLNKYHIQGVKVDDAIVKKYHLHHTGGNDERTY